MPPGPTSVRNRVSANSWLTSFNSRSRPINEVTWWGRLLGGASIERRCDSVERIVKDGMNTVSRGLDDPAAMAKHSVLCDRVMARERGAHPLRRCVPKPGASLDVGEQERYGASRCLHGGAILCV